MTDLWWRDYAACEGLPAEWWFPDVGSQAPNGRAICRVCPVKVECARFAIDMFEPAGIWGGWSAKQRLRIRQRMTPTCLQCGLRSYTVRDDRCPACTRSVERAVAS